MRSSAATLIRIGAQGSLGGHARVAQVEIAARRVGAAVAGARVESALAPGMVTMKTFDPPLDALGVLQIDGVRRRGKMLWWSSATSAS